MGWFDGTSNPDGTKSYLGGVLQYNPKNDIAPNNRLGLFGSAMQDAAAQLEGRPSEATHITSFQNQALQQSQMAAAAQARQAIADANGDPVKMKAALLNYALLGGDTGSLVSAMKYGQPELRDLPQGSAVAVIDPATGKQINTIRGTPLPPKSRTVQQGMNNVDQQYNQDTGQWETIGSGPKFRPLAPKADAPGAVVMPWQKFGGK